MKKRLLSVLLCATLVMGNVVCSYAEEEGSDIGTVAETVIELEGDVSDRLFINGAISPEYNDVDLPIYISDNASDLDYAGDSDISQLYTYLYEEMMKMNTNIMLSDYSQYLSGTQEDVALALENAVIGVINEHPELYKVTGAYRYGMTVNGAVYKAYRLAMVYDTKEYDDELLEQRINEALSVVKDGMTEAQKVVALHDYLALNCEYDKERLVNGTLSEHRDTRNIYGVFVDRMAVCQGYACALQYLLNRIGIEAHMVTSVNINHAWNIVKVDGKYYQVDVTFDDPTWDKLGRVMHDNMLCSDNESSFYSAHVDSTKGKDWVIYKDYAVSDLTATDTKYDNAYWKNAYSALVLHDDYYYFLELYVNGIILTKYSADSISGADAEELVTIWDSDYEWSNAYDINGVLYFNDSKNIYAYDYTSGKYEPVFTAPSGVINGSAYLQGSIYYATNYPSAARQNVVKADIDLTPVRPEFSNVQIMGADATYDGALTMVYHFKVNSDAADLTGAYVEYEDESKINILSLDTEKGYDYVRYKVAIPVPVKDITSTQSIKFCKADGTVCAVMDASGASIGNRLTVSASNYLSTIVANKDSAYTEKDIDRAKHLLLYAQCADTYFDGADAVVSDELAGFDENKFSVEGSATTNIYGDKLTFLGTTLVLENTTKLRIYFKIDEACSIDDFNVEVGGSGNYRTNKLTNLIYYVESDYAGILNSEMGCGVKITDSADGMYAYSTKVYYYMRQALDTTDNEALADLVKAMWLFAESCNK